jgi:hypothetical protein
MWECLKEHVRMPEGTTITEENRQTKIKGTLTQETKEWQVNWVCL